MKKIRPPSKNQLSQLWLEEYCTDRIKCCGLCDNCGIIKRGGIKFYCICPNGRALRKRGGTRPPQL